MSEVAVRFPEVDENGRFKSGNIGGPGRPKGARNKLAEVMIDDLFRHWKEHGIQAIETVFKNKPSDYLKIVAMIVLKCESVGSMADDLYDSAVEAVLEERRRRVVLELERTRGNDASSETL